MFVFLVVVAITICIGRLVFSVVAGFFFQHHETIAEFLLEGVRFLQVVFVCLRVPRYYYYLKQQQQQKTKQLRLLFIKDEEIMANKKFISSISI